MPPRKLWAVAAVVACVALLAACNIKETKSEDGKQKNVSIQTPVGDMKISTQASAEQVGVAVYPGAQLKPKSGNDESSANVNISTSLFGVRVVVLEYVTDDVPDKVAEFYKKELAKYGAVLECHTGRNPGSVVMKKSKDHELSCDKDNHGNTLELKVGADDHQRVVAVKPGSKGTEFALVYVSTRGKDDSL
ncbi:MAG: hypothetical protein ACE14L_05695 [Terriglobales bacterium]